MAEKNNLDNLVTLNYGVNSKKENGNNLFKILILINYV